MIIDKSLWGPGPWEDEPDKEQWCDSATGLPCLVVRNQSGALCGYVGVPRGHPWFGVDCWHIEPPPQVHGGVNYSALCQAGPEAETVCHVADDNEALVWWLGFDCSHGGDLSPAALAACRYLGMPTPSLDRLAKSLTYRTIGYVRAEVERLAAQAARITRGEVVL